MASDEHSAAPGPTLWRITDRRAFTALRREGRRARTGAVGLTWLAPSGDDVTAPPRVGFAVARAAGGAVARNRIRRRLRAGLRELRTAGQLPGGTYLVAAGPEVRAMPWQQLLTTLREAVTTVTGERRART